MTSSASKKLIIIHAFNYPLSYPPHSTVRSQEEEINIRIVIILLHLYSPGVSWDQSPLADIYSPVAELQLTPSMTKRCWVDLCVAVSLTRREMQPSGFFTFAPQSMWRWRDRKWQRCVREMVNPPPQRQLLLWSVREKENREGGRRWIDKVKNYGNTGATAIFIFSLKEIWFSKAPLTVRVPHRTLLGNMQKRKITVSTLSMTSPWQLLRRLNDSTCCNCARGTVLCVCVGVCTHLGGHKMHELILVRWKKNIGECWNHPLIEGHFY